MQAALWTRIKGEASVAKSIDLIGSFADAFVPEDASATIAVDIRRDDAIWEILQAGLGSSDSVTFKRAIVLLKTVLRSCEKSARPQKKYPNRKAKPAPPAECSGVRANQTAEKTEFRFTKHFYWSTENSATWDVLVRTFMAKAETSNHLSRQELQLWPMVLAAVDEDMQRTRNRHSVSDASHACVSGLLPWALCAFAVFFDYDSKYFRQQALRQLLCYNIPRHLPTIASSQPFIDFIFHNVFPVMARPAYYSVTMRNNAHTTDPAAYERPDPTAGRGGIITHTDTNVTPHKGKSTGQRTTPAIRDEISTGPIGSGDGISVPTGARGVTTTTATTATTTVGTTTVGVSIGGGSSGGGAGPGHLHKQLNGRGDADCVSDVVDTVTLLPQFFSDVAGLLPGAERRHFIRRFVEALRTVTDGVAVGVLSICLTAFAAITTHGHGNHGNGSLGNPVATCSETASCATTVYDRACMELLSGNVVHNIGKSSSHAWRVEAIRNIVTSICTLGSAPYTSVCTCDDACVCACACECVSPSHPADTPHPSAPTDVTAECVLWLVTSLVQLQGAGSGQLTYVQSLLNASSRGLCRLRVRGVTGKVRYFAQEIACLVGSFSPVLSAEGQGRGAGDRFSGPLDEDAVELYHARALGLAAVVTALAQYPHSAEEGDHADTQADKEVRYVVEAALRSVARTLGQGVTSLCGVRGSPGNAAAGTARRTDTYTDIDTDTGRPLFTAVMYSAGALLNHSLELWARHPSPLTQSMYAQVLGGRTEPGPTGPKEAQKSDSGTLCGGAAVGVSVALLHALNELLNKAQYGSHAAVAPSVILLASLHTHVLEHVYKTDANFELEAYLESRCVTDLAHICTLPYMDTVNTADVGGTETMETKVNVRKAKSSIAYHKTLCSERIAGSDNVTCAPFFASVLSLGSIAHRHEDWLIAPRAKQDSLIPSHAKQDIPHPSPTSCPETQQQSHARTPTGRVPTSVSTEEDIAAVCDRLGLSVVSVDTWREVIRTLNGVVVMRAQAQSLGHWGTHFAIASDGVMRMAFRRVLANCTVGGAFDGAWFPLQLSRLGHMLQPHCYRL
ncbi:hypothetical protein, variant [Sphaeroforma arctica JP610]|uniref:Uncharacterized protein n=1 Tax=Sphaeroforma arctica JP610 TaxID=667725 RepID=A0A0L0G4Z1_9EUKA|nr:hypothetical protein, variant [Sphaeroforma arctica JP610]KNC83891.1 hypothetical protein, variant [Sphaeroforma arctica JP610]|eukprot:XP_014157793.1 hypothetical protein, variant [Sphaeroforma arctica JP610]